MIAESGILALVVPLAAFAIAAMLIPLLVRSPRLFAGMIDRPNARSLHTGAIPRTGGVAVVSGLAVAGAIAWLGLPLSSHWVWIAVAASLVAAVSILDDRGGLNPGFRLAAHAAAALILLAGGLSWSPIELPGLAIDAKSILSYGLTLLFVVWMINLYNFMDGMDGLAGSMAVFGFGALALLGWQAGDPSFAILSAAVAAAAGGFLLGNLPPARIFLGDLGSTTLGLLAAALSLLGTRRGLFPLWVAWLAFSPFIVDATWTLLRRTLRGERVWQAHRSHQYQRLVLAGWSHGRTLVHAAILMAACAATAVAAPRMNIPDQWFLIGAWGLIYAFIGYRTRLVERRAGNRAP